MENNGYKKHETFTTYEVNDRKFIINAYDPMTGNYILMQVLTFVLPMGLGKELGKQTGTETKVPSVVTENAKLMPKEDFINLQKDILSTVYEEMPGGHRSPVLRDNGTYGVNDVTMGLVLKLLVASLAFNFKDFFEEFQSIEEFMNH